VVLNQLYTLTDLQTTFGVINLSLVNNRPETLNLLETIQLFIEHRREVVSRRTHYDLTKAEAQRELVEGLGMVTTETDLVIRTIRESQDPEEARQRLMSLPLRGLEEFVKRAGQELDPDRAGDYFLSERQAKAILEMRLSRLTGLEQEKLAKEYAELCSEIARLSAILADEGKLMNLIVEELSELREKYGEDRRTVIVDNEAEILLEDLIQEEQMVVTISHGGYIKRTALSTYRAQKRGGKGNRGTGARDDDFISQLFICSTHSFVFFFSDRGKVYVKKVYEVPPSARGGQGRAIVNFVGMEPGERITAITPIAGFNEGLYVTTLTRKGQVKKTSVVDYQNYREKGIIGVGIHDNDQLLAAAATDGSRELLIATKKGKSIRFDEQEVRPMGRAAAGVKAIELDDDDEVVAMAITVPEKQQVLAVCERGYGKRTALSEFRQQKRGGKGIILIDTSERNGPVVGLALVGEDDEVMLVTDRGQTIRTRVAEIRETGRNAQGVRVMNVDSDERVVAIEPVGERDDDDTTGLLGAEGEAISVGAEDAAELPLEVDADAGASSDDSSEGAESGTNGSSNGQHSGSDEDET
jgi:DNA gyrase subunit A